jgi:hypothetical protein
MKMSVMKSVQMVLVVITLITLCSRCAASECIDGYAEYKPVFVDPGVRPPAEPYFIDESRVNAEHYESIQFVFEYYDIKYKLVDNKVMVECRVWEDKDYMVNLTNKSNSKKWLADKKEEVLTSQDKYIPGSDLYLRMKRLKKMIESE